jgi:hypothetical protein
MQKKLDQKEKTLNFHQRCPVCCSRFLHFLLTLLTLHPAHPTVTYPTPDSSWALSWARGPSLSSSWGLTGCVGRSMP